MSSSVFIGPHNAQACKQCLCTFYGFGVKFKNVPECYIENAQKGLCKAKFAKFACVRYKQYSMSDCPISLSWVLQIVNVDE